MRIKRHRLYADNDQPVNMRRSPNQGGELTAHYLVMHYTAGATAQSSIQHFLKSQSKASAHVVVGREGEITQLVPFNRVAWHAGRSRWHSLIGLNRHSIGIELDNAGPLEGGPGQWRAWFGRQYPDEDVVVAAHKLDGIDRGWHVYSETQLSVALEVAEAIVAHYGLVDVLGHDDIAPERKLDPGPVFPMESFRGFLIGRADDDLELFETVASLNIREGPGVGFDKIDGSPLAKGTRLRGEVRDGSWHFVEVINERGEPHTTGWVHGNFITPCSNASV